MLIDPRRHRRIPADAGAVDDPTVLMGLALEVAPLRDLAEWEAVGLDLDLLALALRQEDAITGTTIARLRRRAAAWAPLAPELRAWFAANVDHAGTRACLLYRFGEAGPPAGWAIGTARRRWEEFHGSPCPFDLSPPPLTATRKP